MNLYIHSTNYTNLTSHTCAKKGIQTSLLKTFKNEKGCRDDFSKKRRNKVGMSGMRSLLERTACRIDEYRSEHHVGMGRGAE